MSLPASNVVEVLDRNSLVNAALEVGYVAFLPVYDPGIDMILYREGDGRTLKVRLESRWTDDRIDDGHDVRVAVRDGGDWYLLPTNEMVRRGPDPARESHDRAKGYETATPQTKADLSEFALRAVLGGQATKPPSRGPSIAAQMQRYREQFRTNQPPLGVEGILALRDEGRRF